MSTPSGICECGCGKNTRVPSKTNRRAGQTRGVPLRFINGHNKLRGDRNPAWKGGTHSHGADGYQQIASARHGGRTIYLHRYVLEEHLGRKLLSTEHVHHISGDRKDNRLENLELLSRSEHARRHRPSTMDGALRLAQDYSRAELDLRDWCLR